jgi:photosystem II stability/assembly factor-like uncharacterized protein
MEQLGRVADCGACPPTAPDQIPVTRLIPRNDQVDQAASEKVANLPLWFEPNREQADPIYASVFDGTTAGSFEVARVYKSVDGGATWSATPGSGPRSSRSLLLIDPRNPATLYFYGAGGPYKTSDGGATWRAIETGLSGQSCYSMAINPQNSSVLYLGTEKGVFKSVDGGASWAGTSVTANTLVLAPDPQNPQVVYAFITDILAESASGKANPRSRKGQDVRPMGVLKSIDGGATWTQVNDGRQHPLGVAQAVVIDPNDIQILYLASTGNLFKSVDGGTTWQATATRDTNFGFNTLAFTGGDRSVLYTNGSPNNAVFVAKINPAGTALVYSTYMGGFSGDQGSAIAVDSAGSAVVVGQPDRLVFLRLPMHRRDSLAVAVPTSSWRALAPRDLLNSPPFWAVMTTI